MSLDVPVPDPPSLSGHQSTDDYEAMDNQVENDHDNYRRAAVADALAEGAWADGFEEWARSSDLAETDFETVRRLGLFEQLDFYWDPQSDEVGYRAPELPPEARGDLRSTAADDVDDELDALGRVVSERLENDYMLRDEETFGFFPDDEPTDEYEFRDDE